MSVSNDFSMMPLTNLTSGQKTSSSSKITQDDIQDLIDSGWEIQDPNDSGLQLDDFLQLIVMQFQNQTIDETASTTDMINQMVQMSVIQMLSTVSTSINTMVDASTLSYAASLVGKEVTIGEYDAEGNLTQTVGTVTGTGTYQGAQVIFVDGKQYYLNQILAVGKVPDGIIDGGEEGGEGEGGGEEGGEGGTEGTESV